jgi:hypothetical protein
MNEIRTLKAVEYKGCKVYVRNFNNTFEYLAIIKGELYTAHMVITKRPLQSLLGRDYTEKQLTDATKYLLNTAEATVDFILEEKGSKSP